MSIPRLLRIRESLASRISLWVVLYVVVVLTATAFIANYYVVKSIKLEESVKANGILYIVGQGIEATLTSVEIAVRNHVGDIKENLNSPEALYQVTQRMLKDNPPLVGSAIAFRPGYFPEKGRWFAPYSYRERLRVGGVVHTKQLGCAEYDYFAMDWYKTTDSLRHDYWSEPYFDEGGSGLPIITYSSPLLDDAGRVIAVVTADILLDDLTELLDLQFYEHAYACMISRSGTFISHPNKELVLRQSIFSVAEQMGNSELKEIGQEVISGKSGMRGWTSPTLGKSYIFFVPLQHTGWSMAFVCKASELFNGVRRTALFLGALFFLMLVLLTYILRRSIHRLIAPLTTFTRAADEVAQGNLQAALPEIHSKDEMQRLHRSFGTMQQSLVCQMEELKQVNEAKGRIEGELKAASEIQLSMLPKAFDNTCRRDLDIHGQLISAKEVGGDLYDFFIRDEKLFFCIGDVSGKGVPAALVMARTLNQFRNLISYEDDPAKIISSINRTACDGNESLMFVTFFMGVLDLASRRLRYVNAGHNKPIVITNDELRMNDELQMTNEDGQSGNRHSSFVIRHSELDAKPNLPLGIDEDAPYVIHECYLPSGAMLFLYTDGLTEAMNSQNEQFGLERVKDVLTSKLQNPTTSNPQTLIESMTQAVHQFVGDASQSDDLTMLAIRTT